MVLLDQRCAVVRKLFATASTRVARRYGGAGILDCRSGALSAVPTRARHAMFSRRHRQVVSALRCTAPVLVEVFRFSSRATETTRQQKLKPNICHETSLTTLSPANSYSGWYPRQRGFLSTKNKLTKVQSNYNQELENFTPLFSKRGPFFTRYC